MDGGGTTARKQELVQCTEQLPRATPGAKADDPMDGGGRATPGAKAESAGNYLEGANNAGHQKNAQPSNPKKWRIDTCSRIRHLSFV